MKLLTPPLRYRSRTGAPCSHQRTWAENEIFRLLLCNCRPEASLIRSPGSASHIFFGPCTPKRTWGTRPDRVTESRDMQFRHRLESKVAVHGGIG
jgi:hypothetical protein